MSLVYRLEFPHIRGRDGGIKAVLGSALHLWQILLEHLSLLVTYFHISILPNKSKIATKSPLTMLVSRQPMQMAV